ncbi:MAG: nucleoside/nucleotide kinase family protein [Firmicutes bacterium]|nr:nucleoside/nucleotide kinase family protein [Bacillota bacterium]
MNRPLSEKASESGTICLTESGACCFTFENSGLETTAYFDMADIRDIFAPLLAEWTARQKALGRRMFVFLAAPPGCGKTTLVSFLAALSRDPRFVPDGTLPVQAAPMDGFHHYAAWLKSHTTVRDGRTILFDEIKGAPETFDVDALAAKLIEARASDTVLWPSYSRTLHDVLPDSGTLTGQIFLVEGNYLLLDSSPWKELAGQFCDYSLYMYADLSILRERLIARKTASGHPQAEAEAFYAFSDGRNAELVLTDRPKKADLLLEVRDGRYYITGGSDISLQSAPLSAESL